MVGRRQGKPADFPALAPLVAGTVTIAVAVGSATSALPTGTVAGDVIEVAVTSDTHFTFGATAATTDMVVPAGAVVRYVVPSGQTAIAAIRVSADGTLSCTRMV